MGESNIFFYISCGTLIWVRIIPFKVDPSLTALIRTYINIHASAHLCLVRLKLLCGKQKTGESKFFLYFLWYVVMGEDYTTQSQSKFHWYILHLYN